MSKDLGDVVEAKIVVKKSADEEGFSIRFTFEKVEAMLRELQSVIRVIFEYSIPQMPYSIRSSHTAVKSNRGTR